MSIMRAAFGPVDQVSNPNSWMARAIGGGKTNAGTYVSEYTALNLPVIYRAVSLIADALAYMPINMYRRENNKKVLADDREDYWVLSMRPNENMTSFVWRQTTQSHSLLWGNGYNSIVRTGKGMATEIIPLLPDRTRPVKEAGKDLHYTTNIDGEQVKLPAADVIHIPALGFDGLCGYSPVYMARQAVGMALALEEFGAKFFANDAKSGGFIHYPGQLNEKAQKNIKESLERQSGLDNAHRVKVLEEGAKFIQTTIPPEDAQFLGSREFQIAEIARLYGVPLHMLQSHEKVTSWGSGIEEMTLGFVIFTLAPWIARLEQELNRKLFMPSEQKTFYVKLNINALLRGDANSRADFYQKAIQSGWMTVNEAREKEDMDPLQEPEPEKTTTEIIPPAQPGQQPQEQEPDDV
jgi:HK97 family phage portal protein